MIELRFYHSWHILGHDFDLDLHSDLDWRYLKLDLDWYLNSDFDRDLDSHLNLGLDLELHIELDLENYT